MTELRCVRPVPDTNLQVGYHPTAGWVALRDGRVLPPGKVQVRQHGRRRCMSVGGLMRLAGAMTTDTDPNWLEDEQPLPLDHLGLAYDVCSWDTAAPLVRTRAPRSKLLPGTALTPATHPRDGRLMHTLVGSDGRKTVKQLAWLVLAAVEGPPPHPSWVAAHGDGDCLNNAASNLRWASRPDNWQDSYRHGTARAPFPLNRTKEVA